MNETTHRLARPSDESEIKSLLYETAVWLSTKGSSQWSGLLKGEDVHNIERAIQRKEVFIVSDDEVVVGTFALWNTQTEWDKDLWGEDTSEDYLYLHRVALSPHAHGKNYGRSLLSAAKEVAKEQNKKEIRLDCIASNDYLNKFYQSNGFTFVKTIEEYDNGEGLQDYNIYYWKNE
ncbi:GNAT family N-acetyltransferase [Alkalibacterium sp. MB6]|uniref:GNAT family N-acetyltransferase n=1 Tax=Alkalibacterium sp. MB6 TaxID=2081965 RepID=UPI00137A2B8D|nr:GNAT family N-acetyltransferase [Alkalibacterium sp. MB6]